MTLMFVIAGFLIVFYFQMFFTYKWMERNSSNREDNVFLSITASVCLDLLLTVAGKFLYVEFFNIIFPALGITLGVGGIILLKQTPKVFNYFKTPSLKEKELIPLLDEEELEKTQEFVDKELLRFENKN